MPYRFQPWLLALVLLMAIALLALIANAQPRPGAIETSDEVSSEMAFTFIEGLSGEFVVIRWKDGREFHVRMHAITLFRLFPKGHEGGDPDGAVLEMVIGSSMQRVVVTPELAALLASRGSRTTHAVFDSDGTLVGGDQFNQKH